MLLPGTKDLNLTWATITPLVERDRRDARAPRPFLLNFLYVLYFIHFIYFFGRDSGGTIPLAR